MAVIAPPFRRVPLPRTWSVRAGDVVALVLGNAALIAGMWLRHGGLLQLDSLGGILTAGGQLTALFGTYAVLLLLILMSRSPWLDQLFGMDRLAVYHRWLGFAAMWLLVAHGALTTAGYALGDGSSVVAEAWTLLTTYPYVLMATVSGGLFVVIAVASVRAVRRRVSYEAWFGIHLYAYLAVALGFAHQLVVGTDFSQDPVARGYWILLYVVVVASILVFRVGQPLYVSARHQLRVAHVAREAPDVVSVYVTGRDLDQLAARSGQYFVWRFLTKDGWWRGHPFSLSAQPNGSYLRITVKGFGEGSARLLSMRPGVRVFVEGPYGILTGARRTRERVALIAGGIGITPLRALMEAFPYGPGDLSLVYRASGPQDLIFRQELDALASRRGAAIHYLVGRRQSRELPEDPLGPHALRRLVPDIVERDVFICGPDQMMEHTRRSLRSIGVPDPQIHLERFAY